MLHSNYRKTVDVQSNKRQLAAASAHVFNAREEDIRRAMYIALAALVASLLIVGAFLYASFSLQTDYYNSDAAPVLLQDPSRREPAPPAPKPQETATPDADEMPAWNPATDPAPVP